LQVYKAFGRARESHRTPDVIIGIEMVTPLINDGNVLAPLSRTN